jgi:hypothetical protein
MSDFLNQLRNGGGGNKRFDRNRKPFDGPSFRGPERHGPPRDHKNSGPPRRAGDPELMPVILRLLESIGEEQKRLADAAEKRLHEAERQTTALLAIAEALARGGAADPAGRPVAPQGEAPDLVPPGEPAELCAEEDGATRDLRQRIQALRDSGLSYEKIAQQFDAEGVPTLSRKGKWHGPAVQRLLSQGR